MSTLQTPATNKEPTPLARVWARVHRGAVLEWLAILAVAYFYAAGALLDFDPRKLQQTGEHNESVTLPLLAEVSVARHGEIPLWNPYTLTGFPHVGDFVNHFWQPVSTLPVLVWGGVNGMKVSIFLSFVIAGLGQWWFAHVFGARGLLRLWAGLLFMTCGGLALLWRVGWYELFLGMAWFPWCFGTIWWALARRDLRSMAFAALCVAMALSAGGGYYPVYLFGCAIVLTAASVASASAGQRWPRVRRAAVIAALAGMLLAVMLLPLIDGYRYTGRQAMPDAYQGGSQRISHALVSYVVSEVDWSKTTVLGGVAGFNWFYVGALPILALSLVPLAMRQRTGRPELLALVALLLFLLVWQASKYAPMKWIYAWIPFLYTFRFTGRLLIVATSPLLVLGALGLQHVWALARERCRTLSFIVARDAEPASGRALSMRWLADVVLVVLLLVSVRGVFVTNKAYAFAPGQIDARSFDALSWLKQHDSELFYTSLGADQILWGFAPAAYALEMPILNFNYNRELRTYRAQNEPPSPFSAKPRYVVGWSSYPAPAGGTPVREHEGVTVWRMPEPLPFAFAAPGALLDSKAPVTLDQVTPLAVRLDGPNRVVVSAAATAPDARLIVLVSDYPGWTLEIDGKPAAVVPVNAYLGAMLMSGRHEYVFSFGSTKYSIGLWISMLGLVVLAGMLAIGSWPGMEGLRLRARRGGGDDASQRFETGREVA